LVEVFEVCTNCLTMKEEDIFLAFPKLKSDHKFKITSKQDSRYNCIAWSVIYDDRNLWPPGGEVRLDGVMYLWPDDLPKDESVDTFIKLYQKFNFEVCDSADFEEGYRKIAIYVNPKNKKVTHASRQRSNGDWTSKLGPQHDIAHSDPYTLEGPAYGEVAMLMKKKFI
jgi:hypothetical protein